MIETNEKYSWDSNKRELVLRTHGLDFVFWADFVFADPNAVTVQDERHDYGEDRYLVYAMVGQYRLCLCYTPRNGVIHLISLFRIHKNKWGKYYDKK